MHKIKHFKHLMFLFFFLSIPDPGWQKKTQMCALAATEERMFWIHFSVLFVMYRCHQDSRRWWVGYRWSSMVLGFPMMRCSGWKNPPQTERDGEEELEVPDGSFCSPLSCDCDCSLCTETFCGWRTHFRAADVAGVHWPLAAVSVCCWSFSLRGRLAPRRQSHPQR